MYCFFNKSVILYTKNNPAKCTLRIFPTVSGTTPWGQDTGTWTLKSQTLLVSLCRTDGQALKADRGSRDSGCRTKCQKTQEKLGLMPLEGSEETLNLNTYSWEMRVLTTTAKEINSGCKTGGKGRTVSQDIILVCSFLSYA